MNDTYKHAFKLNSSVTVSDVKEYLSKQPHRQTQFQYKKKQNSVVSPHPLFEIEVDSVDVSKNASENQVIRYGFVGRDNLTKYAWVVPIKTQQPHDVTKAVQDISDEIGVPMQVYSDQEGAFNNAEFIRSIDEQKVKHSMVVDNTQSIERFDRTLKENIHRMLTAMGFDTDTWTSQLEAVVNKANNIDHTTVKMTPTETINEGSTLMVSYNMWDDAKRERAYPEVKVGDEVRVMLRRDNSAKGTDPTWSTHTIYNYMYKRYCFYAK